MGQVCKRFSERNGGRSVRIQIVCGQNLVTRQYDAWGGKISSSRLEGTLLLFLEDIKGTFRVWWVHIFVLWFGELVKDTNIIAPLVYILLDHDLLIIDLHTKYDLLTIWSRLNKEKQ